MPDIIIVAGPNGAGKTSFAKAYLPRHKRRFTYVNADEIARHLETDGNLEHSEAKAARLMLERVDTAVARGENIMIETTLASRTYARKIVQWRQRHYTIGLIYLKLANPELSIARVARRVAAGGHAIPEHVIRRRFIKSLDYLDKFYKPIVDEWYIWNSLEGSFEPSEAWDMS